MWRAARLIREGNEKTHALSEKNLQNCNSSANKLLKEDDRDTST